MISSNTKSQDPVVDTTAEEGECSRGTCPGQNVLIPIIGYFAGWLAGEIPTRLLDNSPTNKLAVSQSRTSQLADGEFFNHGKTLIYLYAK